MKWHELSEAERVRQTLMRLHDVKTNHDKTATRDSEIVIDYLQCQDYDEDEETGIIEIRY